MRPGRLVHRCSVCCRTDLMRPGRVVHVVYEVTADGAQLIWPAMVLTAPPAPPQATSRDTRHRWARHRTTPIAQGNGRRLIEAEHQPVL